jgi:hypothetical protein
MKAKVLLLILPLWAVFSGFVQKTGDSQIISTEEYDRIISRAEDFFKKGPCSVQYKIASFSSHEAKQVHDAQEGKAVLNGNDYYSDFLGLQSLQNKKYRIVIDSATRSISVANASTADAYKPLTENYKLFKTYFKTIQKTNTDNGFSLELVFKEKLKIKKMVMDFAENGFLKKATTYLNAEVGGGSDQSPRYKPRIETSFYGYKKEDAAKCNAYFDETRYITVSSGKIKPAAAYSHYTIKDTRIKP